MNELEKILRYFSSDICEFIINVIKNDSKIINDIREIRIRVGKPIILKLKNDDIVLRYTVSQQEILKILLSVRRTPAVYWVAPPCSIKPRLLNSKVKENAGIIKNTSKMDKNTFFMIKPRYYFNLS